MDLNFSESEKNFLLDLVKKALFVAAHENRRLNEDEVPPLPVGIVQEKMGAFVTYHKIHQGNDFRELRGCIGLMQAHYPLWLSVLYMAYGAAREDGRFKPIIPDELPQIHFEITVLGPSAPCKKEEIELGKHGIILKSNNRSAVFLPHVPIEQGWDLETTFKHLCLKAGLAQNVWENENTEFYCFEGLVLQ